MRKSILATALAGILVWAGVASAAPLAPDLSTDGAGDFVGGVACTVLGVGYTSCVAGEGAAPNTLIDEPGGESIPSTAVQHLDWIVAHDLTATGGYRYFYQMESTSISSLATVTIQSNRYAAGSATSAAGDLDVSHTFVVFANLAVENAPFGDHEVNPNFGAPPGTPNLCCVAPTGVNQGLSNLSATFDPELGTGGVPCGGPAEQSCENESTIITAQGIAPVYVNWRAIDGFSWDSTHAVSDPLNQPVRVAAPGVPEPASVLLLGSGLVGLGFWARRRKS